MAGGKYYWLKLKRDFFKRHDIRIIESMPNGKDYILFYLKLLCESVDHEGNLRFSDQIPYNEDMLATITNTNVDIVRNAIKIFTELNMMDVMDDGTFYMNEVEKMIGSASQDDHTRESTRLRVQAYRERQKTAKIEDKRYSNVTCNGEIEIEKEIDIDIDKEKKNKKEIAKRFKPPFVEEVYEYCKERNNGIDAQAFVDFYESKNWMIGKNKMKDWKACVRTWEKRNNQTKRETPSPFGDFPQRQQSNEDLERKLLSGRYKNN
jgi:predicted phage replisome organizer